jgi:hypothetical protein
VACRRSLGISARRRQTALKLPAGRFVPSQPTNRTNAAAEFDVFLSCSYRPRGGGTRRRCDQGPGPDRLHRPLGAGTRPVMARSPWRSTSAAAGPPPWCLAPLVAWAGGSNGSSPGLQAKQEAQRSSPRSCASHASAHNPAVAGRRQADPSGACSRSRLSKHEQQDTASGPGMPQTGPRRPMPPTRKTPWRWLAGRGRSQAPGRIFSSRRSQLREMRSPGTGAVHRPVRRLSRRSPGRPRSRSRDRLAEDSEKSRRPGSSGFRPGHPQGPNTRRCPSRRPSRTFRRARPDRRAA